MTLALLSGARLLCLKGAQTTAPACCRWLPCAGRDCADARVLARDSEGAPVSPLPSELLLKSPASARRWLHMGRQLLLENQPEKARYCIDRSVVLAPNSPPVLLEAAAFFHATGQSARGLELMSRVVAATREYDEVIFPFYRRAADVTTVLRQGLPAGGASAARSYFLHLLEQRDFSSARNTWEWLSSSHHADRVTLRRYLARLIEHGLYEEAARAFESSLPPEEPLQGNRIAHGGFEAESTGVPLDWIITPVAHAAARRDNTSAHDGSWSLRMDFDGEANLEYRHVAQQVVVSPGRWRLQAWIRTQDLTSDQGAGLRIFESSPTPDWQVWTKSISGDSEWTLLDTVFTIPPPVRLAQVEIVRRPSRKLDNKLGGIVWVDGVSLTPDETQVGDPAPQSCP